MNTTDRVNWRSIFSISSILYSVLGVLAAMIALEGFMLPNHFIDGGITGISIVSESLFGIPFTIFLIFYNLPFLILGYKRIGKTFAVRAFLAIVLLTLLMYFIEIPAFTNDKVLIAVFGGFLIGLGIGLVIRGGGVLDGLEIIAFYTTRNSSFSTGEIILAFNAVIFIISAFVFSVETAMYSFLVYFTAMKTSDYVVDGFEEFTALNIISKECDEVKALIVKDLGKAITVYRGERGYLPDSFDIKYDCDIVMTIVSRLEIHRLKEAILKIDADAFFYVQRIKEVKGGIGKHTKDAFNEQSILSDISKRDVKAGK